MKILLAVCAALALLAPLLLWKRHRLAHPRDDGDLEACLEGEFAKMQSMQAPGAALLAVAYKDGRTWVRSSGHVKDAGDTAPDMQTLFQIGSITKVFTVAMVQALVDAGRLNWDDTVAATLPSGIPVAPGYRAMTLRQLATHTAGLPSIPSYIEKAATARAPRQDVDADPFSRLRLDDVLAQLAALSGRQKAGRFQYSNYGMGLLGHVIALNTGRSYAELVHELVLAPAGMVSTRVGLDPDQAGQMADGHDAKGRPVIAWTFGALEAAGAIHSNGEDMMRFATASLDPSSPFSALLDKMAAPQCSGKTGLGWLQAHLIDKIAGNTGVVWHNGMTGSHAAYLALDQGRRLSVLVLSAQARDVAFFGMMFMRHVRTQSWKKAQPS